MVSLAYKNRSIEHCVFYLLLFNLLVHLTHPQKHIDEENFFDIKFQYSIL